MSWFDDLKKAAGETLDSAVSGVVDSVKDAAARYEKEAEVAKARQTAHSGLLMRPVSELVLGPDLGVKPTEQEYLEITGEYGIDYREGGIPRDTNMTKAELYARVELLKRQDQADSLNKEGLDLGDATPIIASILNPSPADLLTMLIPAAQGWGWASRAVLESTVGVWVESKFEEAQGNVMTSGEQATQALAGAAIGVGFGSAAAVGKRVLKTTKNVDPAVHESPTRPGEPISPAEVRGASVYVESGGAVPYDEAVAAAQRSFDEVEMRMPKEPPRPKMEPEPPKPKPEKVLVVPDKFQSNHIQIGAGIGVPESQTDRWVLRFALAGDKEKGGILTRARDGVKGFDPKNQAHVNELKNLSLDAERTIVRSLPDSARAVTNKPLFALRLDDMHLWEELQTRIDYLNLRENANPDGVPTWLREDKVPYADASKTLTQRMDAPQVGAGPQAPKETMAVQKLNKAMREIASRMGSGKQYNSVIKNLLADPDTTDLPPEAQRKLMALRDLMDDKLGPDDQGFINSKSLATLHEVLDAVDQDSMRRRVSGAATRSADEQVTKSMQQQAFGDFYDAMDQYRKDREAYTKAKAEYDQSVKLGKKLDDGGDLPEPMPPKHPLDSKVFLEASLKQMAAVSGLFGNVPFLADPTGGANPKSGMGWRTLFNPELRLSIPGVGDVNSAIERGQRQALTTFIEMINKLDTGTASTMWHSFKGLSKEEQRIIHEAMFKGGSPDPKYNAIVKVWQEWWNKSAQELARAGLPTGTLKSYAPQDLSEALVTKVGRDVFVQKIAPHIKGGARAAEGLFDAVADQGKASLYAKSNRTLQSRQFEFNDAASAWAVLQEFSDKPYTTMLLDKLMGVEGTIAATRLLGPDPVRLLRKLVDQSARDAKEAWAQATQADRKKYMDPAEIDRWQEALSGAAYGTTRSGGVIGSIFGELNNTSASNAVKLVEMIQGSMVSVMTSASSKFLPIDMARNALFMVNQMPMGGQYNPLNWVSAPLSMLNEIRKGIDNFANVYTGQKSSRLDWEQQADYLGLSAHIPAREYEQISLLRSGIGGTAIEDVSGTVGRVVTKATRAGASILAHAQGLPLLNYAQSRGAVHAFMMNLGDQIHASGGDMNALKGGGYNAYNMWVKLRQAGIDAKIFRQIHDTMVNNNLLLDVKKSGWLKTSHKIADIENLYKINPKLGNLLSNMIEANKAGGVGESDAYHRIIRRRGGAYVSKWFSDTQQGTGQGVLMNAIAALTNTMSKTSNDFLSEATINGPVGLLPAGAMLLVASYAMYTPWALMTGQVTQEELEQDPYMIIATPAHVGKIVDNSGLAGHFGFIASGGGLYSATHDQNVSITGSGERIESALGFMADYAVDQVTDKPLFGMAQDIFAGGKYLGNKGAFLGMENAMQIPTWDQKKAAIIAPLIPNPIMLQMFGINLQDYYLNAHAPTVAANRSVRKAVKRAIINREDAKFSGIPDWMKRKQEGE